MPPPCTDHTTTRTRSGPRLFRADRRGSPCRPYPGAGAPSPRSGSPAACPSRPPRRSRCRCSAGPRRTPATQAAPRPRRQSVPVARSGASTSKGSTAVRRGAVPVRQVCAARCCASTIPTPRSAFAGRPRSPLCLTSSGGPAAESQKAQAVGIGCALDRRALQSPTRGRSSVGRASASQAEGRGFETRRPLARPRTFSPDLAANDGFPAVVR